MNSFSEIRTTVSRSTAIAIENYLSLARRLHQWDKENPTPPFERAQEAHKVERLAESLKVAEAADNVIIELERDARGR